mgnify:CR=1 FL=1
MEEKTGKADKKEIRSRKNQKLYRDRFGKGGKIMKKLEIVIRPESLENLELLLEEQKANGMMITNILGYGNQKGYRQMYRGAEIVAKMLPKVKVETVVEDDKVPKIVDFVVEKTCQPETTAMEKFSFTMLKMQCGSGRASTANRHFKKSESYRFRDDRFRRSADGNR